MFKHRSSKAFLWPDKNLLNVTGQIFQLLLENTKKFIYADFIEKENNKSVFFYQKYLINSKRN
jgi:hypothetical protein